MLPLVLPLIPFLGGPLVIWILRKYFGGKKIVVLGQRGVGKSTMVDYLEKGFLVVPVQTLATRKIHNIKIKIRDLKLTLRECVDLPGSQDSYIEWQKKFSEADFALYFVRADRVFSNDSRAIERAVIDMRHIKEWKDNVKKKIVIVGTFFDQVDSLYDIDDAKFTDYQSEFIDKLPALRALGGGDPSVKFVLGSMETKERTEKLVYRVFSEVR